VRPRLCRFARTFPHVFAHGTHDLVQDTHHHAARGRPMTALTIAHVLSSFGMGGQERMALELAISQKKRGHCVLAVSLAAGSEGPLGELFRGAGIPAESVPKHAGVDASLPLRLATLVGGAGADVVHTHNPHAMIYGAPAAGLARAKSVH